MALTRWLPKSNRGGGEYNTGNFTVPAGVNDAFVMLDVTASDFATPDKSITITLEVSLDNAQTWRLMMACGWVGGPLPPAPPGKTPGWYAGVGNLSLYEGKLVRAHFSTSGTFRWGLYGEIS